MNNSLHVAFRIGLRIPKLNEQKSLSPVSDTRTLSPKVTVMCHIVITKDELVSLESLEAFPLQFPGPEFQSFQFNTITLMQVS